MLQCYNVCPSLSPITTEQIVTGMNGVAGPSKLERGSSSSDQEESLCQEDIQKLLGLQQSKVSLDKVSFISRLSYLSNFTVTTSDSQLVADLFFYEFFKLFPLLEDTSRLI